MTSALIEVARLGWNDFRTIGIIDPKASVFYLRVAVTCFYS